MNNTIFLIMNLADVIADRLGPIQLPRSPGYGGAGWLAPPYRRTGGECPTTLNPATLLSALMAAGVSTPSPWSRRHAAPSSF
jgi:hypothetical protein